MFDGLKILSNTSKHDQAAPNKGRVQTVKCLVTKQCLMTMFDGVWSPNISRLSRPLQLKILPGSFFAFKKNIYLEFESPDETDEQEVSKRLPIRAHTFWFESQQRH